MIYEGRWWLPWASMGAVVLVGCGLGGVTAEVCDDRIDNDRDRLWDADDPDCIGVPGAAEPHMPQGDPDAPDSPDAPQPGGTCDHGVSAVEASCTASGNRLNVELAFDGVDEEGLLFIAETVRPYSGAPLWGENHPLEPTDLDDCGGMVRAHLTPGVVLNDQVLGESTVFQCDAHVDGGGLTYVAMLDDAGCVAWGDDPEGLVAGDYDADLLNEPFFSFSSCEVW